MLSSLFEKWAGEPCLQQLALGANGSNRHYVRLIGKTHRCIAALNDDVRENKAFVYLARYFKSRALPVPEVYLVSDDYKCYLQQDLGDTTLYAYAYDKRCEGGGFDKDTLSLYRQAVADLVRFQTAGGDIDYSIAYPRSDFDRQSMQWDLNYFKYYFLKLAYIPFDEQLLENDFSTLIEYLLQEDCTYFMYRDFQSRNIMVSDNRDLYYIDFQGARRGAAQYDLASLIYSAKSDIPDVIREELLEYYLQLMEPHITQRGHSVDTFRHRFYGYVLLRIMQAMGAYGYRGYYERKDHFLKSIPLAIANLKNIVDFHPLPVHLPQLEKVWQAIAQSPLASSFNTSSIADRLTVTVSSFSYKKGIPQDPSGNGGGHVFDCRALPNPGRYPQYRSYTGRDLPVIDFLKDLQEVKTFLDNTQNIVFQSIEKYQERHFASLMVSFGCTGGQHRSVYCAEQMAKRIKQHYDCDVVVRHVEQENKILKN
ncbi:MAG: phosphotransferase [Bacteroidales bacterium]|nr:phosphotransferase [Bacteroidales bacterium]